VKDLNTIMLTGRVDGEPEMRYTGEGELYTTFYLAGAFGGASDELNRRRLIAWGEGLARFCNQLLPAVCVLVEGQLQRCTADEPEERTRFPLEIRVCDVIVTTRREPVRAPRPVRQSPEHRKER
jgi:single-stranded DNA-binding protein